jgi:hypothetical protein
MRKRRECRGKEEVNGAQGGRKRGKMGEIGGNWA